MEPSQDPTAATTVAPTRGRSAAVAFLLGGLGWTALGTALLGRGGVNAAYAHWLLALFVVVPVAVGAYLLYRRVRTIAAAAQTSETRQLHAVTQRLFSLQEDERRAISRELHDDIGQAITAIKMSAHAALDEHDPARRRRDLQSIIGVADDTVGKLRDISMLLRPPQLDALGLEAALRWQSGVLFRAADVRLETDIATLLKRPQDDIALACFRIAQESMTNALRHARARTVRLSLHETAQGALCLRVGDDGRGFEPLSSGAGTGLGLGLVMMRERAQSVGGFLHVESAPGHGCRLQLYLPDVAADAAPPGDTDTSAIAPAA